jgi:AraC family transcriptional regulator of adaptative response / DNA-3-methyladenine glycosylase II
MLPDSEICYRALRTRDARFDGRFFTAVKSTGIYCRPICPAPTPRRENCEFVACAAAAQQAGYRPCLRCRPEAAPGTPAWRGTSATVARALRLIEDGALDRGNVETLAEQVGVGERHLRRLFVSHIGASPRTVARTRRLLFAKKLIDETALPMSEVAYGAGFSSVRRFNEAVREAYGRAPRELRKGSQPAEHDQAIELALPFREPFAWEALHRFFADRAAAGVEHTSPSTYSRSISLSDEGRGAGAGVVEIAMASGQLVARLRWSGPAPLLQVSERLRRLLDLEADPGAVEATLARDPDLASRLARLPGVRVPGAWDGFELAVRAILGQQVSVAAATRLAGILVERFGSQLPESVATAEVTHLFPDAETLAGADLSGLPMPGSRQRALAGLADAVARGSLRLDPSSDVESTLEGLVALSGVGPWTAQYIAMRALRDPDAFPTSDLGLLRALDVDARALALRAAAWRPWRAYAALLLWSTPGASPAGSADDAERVVSRPS